MLLQGLLESGLRRAGGGKVTSAHLSADEFDELLQRSHRDFLWQRSVDDPTDGFKGWGYYTSRSPGLRGWWALQAHLSEHDSRRLRQLRLEVYDWLEQRGMIRRALVAPNPPWHVAPPDAEFPDQAQAASSVPRLTT